jgi:hypothetical protein
MGRGAGGGADAAVEAAVELVVVEGMRADVGEDPFERVAVDRRFSDLGHGARRLNR